MRTIIMYEVDFPKSTLQYSTSNITLLNCYWYNSLLQFNLEHCNPNILRVRYRYPLVQVPYKKYSFISSIISQILFLVLCNAAVRYILLLSFIILTMKSYYLYYRYCFNSTQKLLNLSTYISTFKDSVFQLYSPF